MRKVFDKFDYDGSGNIDMQELLDVLDELGCLKNLRSDPQAFAAEMFLKFDEDENEVLE